MDIKEIEIYGNKNSNILSVGLKDILSCISNGKNYGWCILWLEAMGYKGGAISILDLEKRIKESKDGIFFEWYQLQDLLNNFHQIIQIILIGDKEHSNLKRYEDDEEMYSACYYTIELIDSGFWVVHSKDQASIEQMKNNLDGVKDLP